MKHSLFILISLLILSSPLIGQETLPISGGNGETLYRWENPSGIGFIWKGYGDKKTQSVYKGDVESGKPNGVGIFITPDGSIYVGSWKDGKPNGQGTYTWTNGMKYIGKWNDGEEWNGILYDTNRNIDYEMVNGEME